MDIVNLLRILIFVSIGCYFIFDFFDGKKIKDEREELIRLKTLELVSKVTVWTLTLLALLYIFKPDIDAFYLLIALVLSSLYTEIFGKLYYRQNL